MMGNGSTIRPNTVKTLIAPRRHLATSLKRSCDWFEAHGESRHNEVMGRRSSRRPWGQPHVELDIERARGGRNSVTRRGQEWTVQRIRSSDKAYRCPGCQQMITAGTPHVVAWADDSLFGAEAALADRRHWHVTCWERGF